MNKARQFLRSIILGVSVILISIALLEFCAYIFLYIENGRMVTREEIQQTLGPVIPTGESEEETARRPSDEYMRTHVIHPYIGYVMNYNIPKHTFNDLRIDQQVNQYGFFGTSPQSWDSENTIQIGIFGGSVAAELFLYGSDRLVRELGKSPGFRGKNIRIMSVALAGMRQPQQLMALNYFISLGKHFDIVINLDGFNEVALPYSENVLYDVSPYYPSRWQFFAARSLDNRSILHSADIIRGSQHLEHVRRLVSRWPLRDSYFSLAFWQVFSKYSNQKKAQLEEKIRRRFQASGGKSAQESGPEYHSDKYDTVMKDAVALWKRTSEQMWNICRANNITYLHLLQPNQYVAGSKMLSDWEKEHAWSPPNYWYRHGVEKGYPHLFTAGQELSKAGIPFFDITDSFRETRETIYKDTCCHYNGRGNQILAKRISQIIANHPDI